MKSTGESRAIFRVTRRVAALALIVGALPSALLASSASAAATTPTVTQVVASYNPSVAGQSVTYTVTISNATVTASASPTDETVVVSDGVGVGGNSCTISNAPTSWLATTNQITGSCSFTEAKAASYNVSAYYPGDGTTFEASTGSLLEVVNKAATATTISSISPSSSVSGEAFTVNAAVAAVLPGTGTPTGTVTVSDGAGQTCSFTLPASSCVITETAPTTYAMTASYGGDANFTGSTSSATNEVVGQASSTTSISSTIPALSSGAVTLVVGRPITVNFSVAALLPGTGTPTGTVTVSDGGTDSCTGNLDNLGAGSCVLTPSTYSLTPYTVKATYNASTDFSTSVSTTFAMTVNPAPTSTVLTLSPGTVVSGQTETANVTVSANGQSTATPTGTVNVLVGASTVCTATLSGGSGSCTYSEPASGSLYSVTATYVPANTNFNGSTSSATAMTVNKASSSVAMSVSSTSTVSGQVNTISVIVSAVAPGAGVPSGTVTVSDGTHTCPTAITLSAGAGSCQITETTPGSYTFTGTYSGDTNFNGTTGTTAATVAKAGTTTVITETPQPSGAPGTPAVSGQSVFVTATVTVLAPGTGTPTGTVLITDGAAPGQTCTISTFTGVGPIAGSCIITEASPGTYTLTGVYSGDTNFATSSGTTFLTVNKDATTTVITETPQPGGGLGGSSVSGQKVLVSASVTAYGPSTGTPTGSVVVSDGVGLSCTITLANGVGSCFLAESTPASYTLTGTYSGDANFAVSSGTTNLVVNKANTTTSVTFTPSSSVSGQVVTVTASVAPVAPGAGMPSGQVIITDLPGAQTCTMTLADGIGTCTIAEPTPGSYTVVAAYQGSADFNTSTTNSAAPLVVSRAQTMTVVSVSPNPALVGETVTVSATVTTMAPGAGVPNGTVQVNDGVVGGQTCTITLDIHGTGTCTITETNPGTYTVSGIYQTSTDFNTSTGTTSLAVDLDPTTTAITETPLPGGSSGNPSVSGQSVRLDVTVASVSPGSGVPTGTMIISSGGVNICQFTLTPGVTVSTGTCTIIEYTPGLYNFVATYQGSSTFAVSTGKAYLTVNQAATTLVIASAPLSSSVSGQAVQVMATVSTTLPGTGTPVGTVYIYDGFSSVESCTATLAPGLVANTATGTCTITETLPGSYTFMGSYSGSTDFATSTATTPLTVNQSQTITVLTASSNTSVSGQVITVTAVVTPRLPGAGTPTGVVSVIDGQGVGLQQTCTITLSSGRGTCTISEPAPGTFSLAGFYGGSTDFAGSMGTTPLVVSIAPTTTALSITPTTTASGFTFSVKVTVTPTAPGAGTPAGTVSVSDGVASGATCTITLAGATGTCTIAESTPGLYNFTGTYAGNADYATSKATSPVSTATVAQATLSISSVTGTVGKTLALATSGGSGTGPVTYAMNDSGTAGCELNGDVVTASRAGTCTVTATKAGDVNYATATSSATTITFAAAPAPAPRALRLSSVVTTGRRNVVTIIGVNFYGRPTITSNGRGTTIQVLGDTGHGLLVAITIARNAPRGSHLLRLHFAHGQTTVVRYFQR